MRKLYEPKARTIVERVVGPCVATGEATLEKYPDGHVEVHPRVTSAAEIWLDPGEHYHSLCVGPHGNLHEVLVGNDDAWKAELAQCLEAIIEGRYVEVVRARGTCLEMHFGEPADVVVERSGAGDYGPPGEHRYASYGHRRIDSTT